MEMISPSSARAEETLALAHVRKLKAFYVHLTQYIVVVAGLAVVNAFTSPHVWWALFAAVGWGFGVLSHALLVFNKIPFFTADWERRQVEKRLGRKL